MAEPTIGNWTKAQLNKFIQNAIATEPLVLPKAITIPTVTVTKTLIVQGDMQISDQAKASLLARGL